MAPKRKPKIKKEFAQRWLLESLENDSTYAERRMFGTLAIYFRGRMVVVLAENGEDSDRVWQGKRYPYAIWNGILWPSPRESHPELLRRFPALVPHPVLPKWLYLSLSHPDYESTAQVMLRQITAFDPLYGIEPGTRKKARRKRSR